MIVDDTAWSEPGETAGTPDRYQTRTYRGCRISAGNNWRNRDGSYMRADDDVPWFASIRVDVGIAPAVAKATGLLVGRRQPGGTVFVGAQGIATSQAEARAAAEQAADRLADALAAARAA